MSTIDDGYEEWLAACWEAAKACFAPPEVTRTKEEIEAWLAVRKEAAKVIDPATAKVCRVYGHVFDPYGIAWNDPHPHDWFGGNYFARAPGSNVWVSFSDLPKSVLAELWNRIIKPNAPAVCVSASAALPAFAPFDDGLPNVNLVVAEIMARDTGEPGYAAAVAHGIMKAQSVQ